jgi:hypothetical protein
MSKVKRFCDPSSPRTNAALIADVSFAIGAARVAPESLHPVSGLKSITFVFAVLPPTITASLSDHGKRIGLTAGGTLASNDRT